MGALAARPAQHTNLDTICNGILYLLPKPLLVPVWCAALVPAHRAAVSLSQYLVAL